MIPRNQPNVCAATFVAVDVAAVKLLERLSWNDFGLRNYSDFNVASFRRNSFVLINYCYAVIILYMFIYVRYDVV